MKKKIFEIIDDMEDLIESCKPTAFSAMSIKVNKEEISEMITELRLVIPDEIRRAQNIIDKKDMVISEARDTADNMIAQAKKQTEALISEHEIMQRAYQEANHIIDEAQFRAQEILTQATHDANEMRTGSLMYTGGLLETLDEIVTDMVNDSNAKFLSFVQLLQENQNIIQQNRKEIDTELGVAQTAQNQSYNHYTQEDGDGLEEFEE